MTPEEKRRASFFRSEIDFAFFAARLGWSLGDYEETTPVQRAFVRKEIEAWTVDSSEVLQRAVATAVANTLGKRKRKLWVKRRKKAAPAVPVREIDAIRRKLKSETPWTPWRKEVGNG